MDPQANNDLLDKIKNQGDVVRKLKEQKADKAKVKNCVPFDRIFSYLYFIIHPRHYKLGCLLSI
jgi:hypothetical protein